MVLRHLPCKAVPLRKLTFTQPALVAELPEGVFQDVWQGRNVILTAIAASELGDNKLKYFAKLKL
jgi:hypothetical protein